MRKKIGKKMAMALLAAALCAGSSMTAFAMPEQMPDGGVFDAEYYAEANPDVVAVLGSEKEILYQHYMLAGKSEGRLPGVAFDAAYYAANNPDVAAVLGTGEDVLYQHYRLCGKAEGRLPSAPGTELKPIRSAIPDAPAPTPESGYLFDIWALAGGYEGVNVMPYTEMSISIYSSPEDPLVVGNYIITYPNAGLEYSGELRRDGDKTFAMISNGAVSGVLAVVNETPGAVVVHYADAEFECDYSMFEAYPMP